MAGEILSLLLFSFSCLFGISIISVFDPKKRFSFWERLFAGCFLGILFLGYFVLFLSLVFHSEKKTILFYSYFLIVYFTIFLPLFQRKKLETLFSSLKRYFQELKDFFFGQKTLLVSKHKFFSILVFFFFLFVLFSFLYMNLGLFKKLWGGSCVSFFHGYFDSALHLSLFRVFSEREPFSLEHPLLKGFRLTYTFFADFFSSIPKKLGAEEEFSFELPQALTIAFVSFMLLAFLTRVLSFRWAVVCFLLIFLGSGFAFLNWPQTFSKVFLEKGGKSYQEFTCFEIFGECNQENIKGLIVKNGIPWRTPLFNFFVWQRPFIYGLGLFVFMLMAIFYYAQEMTFLRYSIFVPLFFFAHTHSLISLFFLMVIFFFLQKNKKIWFVFFLLTLVFCWPFFSYFSNVVSNQKNFLSNFLSYHPGWLADDYKDHVLVFYLKNFGFILIFYFLSLFYFDKFSPFLKHLFLAGLFIFIMSNIFIFAPRTFDNNKILFYFWLIACIFTSFFLKEFYGQKKTDFYASFVFILLFLMLLPGFSDLLLGFFHIKNNNFCYRDVSPEIRAMGDFIKQNVPKDAYLVSSGNIDDVALFYAGRGVYVGFSNYLWSHGNFQWKEKEDELKEILRTGDVESLKKKGIFYMVLDKDLKDYWKSVKESAFLEKGKVLYSQPELKRYLLYFPPED